MRAGFVPNTVLRLLHISSSFHLHSSPRSGHWYCTHFTDEEIHNKSSILLKVTKLLCGWAKTWNWVSEILWHFFSISKEDSPRKKFYWIGVEKMILHCLQNVKWLYKTQNWWFNQVLEVEWRWEKHKIRNQELQDLTP